MNLKKNKKKNKRFNSFTSNLDYLLAAATSLLLPTYCIQSEFPWYISQTIRMLQGMKGEKREEECISSEAEMAFSIIYPHLFSLSVDLV